MSFSTSFIDSLVELLKNLFGKIGFTLLIASTAFLAAPSRWLSAIGLNATDQNLRQVVGVTFVVSGAACVVSIALWLKPIAAYLAEGLGFQLAYRSLSKQSRVLLGRYAHARRDQIIVPDACEPVQELLDRGYLWGSQSVGREGYLALGLTSAGMQFVQLYRGELRREVFKNPSIAKQFDAMINGSA